jgi:hypothetical protein
MKNRKQKILEFIELRTWGYTYDEIVMRMNVSKPTLIKWGKDYVNIIKEAEEKFASALVLELVKRNKLILEEIIKISGSIARGNVEEEAKRIIMSRVSKKLYKIFGTKMKKIELVLNKSGSILKAKIIWMH